jgi:hypothetical protein
MSGHFRFHLRSSRTLHKDARGLSDALDIPTSSIRMALMKERCPSYVASFEEAATQLGINELYDEAGKTTGLTELFRTMRKHGSEGPLEIYTFNREQKVGYERFRDRGHSRERVDARYVDRRRSRSRSRSREAHDDARGIRRSLSPLRQVRPKDDDEDDHRGRRYSRSGHAAKCTSCKDPSCGAGSDSEERARSPQRGGILSRSDNWKVASGDDKGGR